MRKNKNTHFIELAKLISDRSTCVRRSVGCIITDKHYHIMSTGYNGVPMNFVHCITKPCDGANSKSGENLNKCLSIHAEQNALLQCKDIMNIHNIYTTCFPCSHCAKLICNTSCKHIYYLEDYVCNESIYLFKECDIKTTKVYL